MLKKTIHAIGFYLVIFQPVLGGENDYRNDLNYRFQRGGQPVFPCVDTEGLTLIEHHQRNAASLETLIEKHQQNTALLEKPLTVAKTGVYTVTDRDKGRTFHPHNNFRWHPYNRFLRSSQPVFPCVNTEGLSLAEQHQQNATLLETLIEKHQQNTTLLEKEKTLLNEPKTQLERNTETFYEQEIRAQEEVTQTQINLVPTENLSCPPALCPNPYFLFS